MLKEALFMTAQSVGTEVSIVVQFPRMDLGNNTQSERSQIFYVIPLT